MELAGLVQISKHEFDKAVQVLTHAFYGDYLYSYFLPDEEQKHRYMPALFEYRLRQGLLAGKAYATSPEVEGVAVWIHSDKLRSSFLRDIRSGAFKLYRLVGRPAIERMVEFERFMTTQRNSYAVEPYIRLGPIAVDPNHQRKGYANRLLRPMLDYLDAQGLPCYIEVQSESNVSFYQRYGFEVHSQLVVPNTEIPHWDMFRNPLK